MRPRLLVLSQCLPYPPHSGVATRTFNILIQLQRAFDVHLLAFSRRNHQPDAAARQRACEELQAHLTCVYEPARISSERSPMHRLGCHALSVLTRRPYTYYDYSADEFRNRLDKAVQTIRPALVHVDSLDLYRWLDRLDGAPVAVTHHSVESELLRLRARHIRSAPLRWYLRSQAHMIEAVERQLCVQLPLNVMMSEVDADRLRRLVPGARTVTIPNGVDTDVFAPRQDLAVQPGRLVFLGPTYMYPNRDAVDFFLSSIWGKIRAECPEAHLHLVGKNSEGDRIRLAAHPAVTCHGYAPDVRPHLAEAACSVVPIRIGGGTRLKILDAWAMGTAVVSTSVGCEGLRVRDGDNILVRDHPEAFAHAVVDVLTNAELRARLGRGGRATVERYYTWGAIGEELIAAYWGLLERQVSPAGCQ